VAVRNLTDRNTSLKEFTEAEITFLEKPPTSTTGEDTTVRTILESEPISIAAGNTQAHKVVYSDKVSGTLSKIMEIYTVNGDKGYILSYVNDATTYDTYLPIVQKMIDSFNMTRTS
jgi:hypothetical protein